MRIKSKPLSLRWLLMEEEGEEGEDLFGDEEETPVGGGDVETTADDEAADDAGDTETEEEEEVEIEPDDEVELRKPLEAQVDNMLADFEMAALKSSAINVDAQTVEGEVVESWWKAPLSSLLVEVDDVADLDIEQFATDVARLIQNYETLLDIESAIYYRAIALLERNYSEETAMAFKDIMQQRYQFDFDDIRDDPTENEAPLALGAAGEGGGGGGV